MRCKTIIIFSDDYFPSLILPYSDEKIFVTNTILSNTYSDEIFLSLKISTFSDEIFRRYRLIKLVPKFPSIGAHFLDHNSDENYFVAID